MLSPLSSTSLKKPEELRKSLQSVPSREALKTLSQQIASRALQKADTQRYLKESKRKGLEYLLPSREIEGTPQGEKSEDKGPKEEVTSKEPRVEAEGREGETKGLPGEGEEVSSKTQESKKLVEQAEQKEGDVKGQKEGDVKEFRAPEKEMEGPADNTQGEGPQETKAPEPQEASQKGDEKGQGGTQEVKGNVGPEGLQKKEAKKPPKKEGKEEAKEVRGEEGKKGATEGEAPKRGEGVAEGMVRGGGGVLDKGPSQISASRGVAGQGPEMPQEMQAWIAQHPDLETRNRILQLGTITEGIRGRVVDLQAQVPKKTWFEGALNWFSGYQDMLKAWQKNPYKVKGFKDIETYLAIIGGFRPFLSMVGNVADKVSLITTILGLVTIWFPPVAGPLMTVSRIASVVSLLAKGLDFILSLVQAALAAIQIGKEKDPVKRAQLAATMREGVMTGVMNVVDAALTFATKAAMKPVEKVVGGALKGAQKGFKNTMNLYSKAPLGKAANPVLKGTLTGLRKGFQESIGEIKKQGLTDLAKEGLKEGVEEGLKTLKENFAPLSPGAFSQQIRDTWEESLKEQNKFFQMRDTFKNKRLFTTYVSFEVAKKSWELAEGEKNLKSSLGMKEVDEYASEEFDKTRSPEVGQEIRKEIAGPPPSTNRDAGAHEKAKNSKVLGHITALNNLIAAAKGEVPKAQTGVGPTGEVIAPELPKPSDSDVLLQKEDYEAIRSQKAMLKELDSTLVKIVSEQASYRDTLLKKVAPTAVKGGQEAIKVAKAVAEQRAENKGDIADLQKSEREADKLNKGILDAKSQGKTAQGEAQRDVEICKQAMEAQPDKSRVEEEAKKKAQEEYEREKREYEKANILGKAWMTIKKFGKSVLDFMGSALKWVWDNVVLKVTETVKGKIGEFANWLTSTIVFWLLKVLGGLSDAEARTLAFGAEAKEKQKQAGVAEKELADAGFVALEASEKATRAEKEAIEEANRANRNIQSAKNIQTEIKGQEQALEQIEQESKAKEKEFIARFGPYFASLSKEKGGQESAGTGEPVVTDGMLSRLEAAAEVVKANSVESESKFAIEAEEIKKEESEKELARVKEEIEAKAKAKVDLITLGNKAKYDEIYNEAAARIRNEATTWARQVVEEHKKGESSRRGRVGAEAAKASGLKGRPLPAVEGMLRQVAMGIKAEDDAIPVDYEKAKGRLRKGFEQMFA